MKETAVSEHPSDEKMQDHPVEPTGHPAVDDVIASLSDLESRSVAEHVAVFESAHDRLRGALSEAASDPAGS